jgi:seryl-tRNA synthetase
MKNVGAVMTVWMVRGSSVEKRYNELIYSIPNILHDSVPTGDSEKTI